MDFIRAWGKFNQFNTFKSENIFSKWEESMQVCIIRRKRNKTTKDDKLTVSE